MGDTHIRVRESTWEELNGLKKPGDSFDDVLGRLLATRKNEGGEE